MLYHICHTTTYNYSQAVFLRPHIVRLRPRCDSWQTLHSFSLKVEPEPVQISEFTDLDGNAIAKLWFKVATEHLKIQVTSTVETHRDNPFDYLLEPEAMKLPIDYLNSLLVQIQPYRQSYGLVVDPAIAQFAQDIYQEVNGKTDVFLSILNQRLYETCEIIIRETGDPLPPGVTLRKKQGSCRDLAVLFMEICRCVGLAARFVSGYQEGDPDQEHYHLHAWVEVYLPGGGWRGYDPIQGLVVADRHVALVASVLPEYTTPVLGNFTAAQPSFEEGKKPESQMDVHLSIIKEEMK